MRMSWRITAHAVDRYIERFEPQITPEAAEAAIREMLAAPLLPVPGGRDGNVRLFVIHRRLTAVIDPQVSTVLTVMDDEGDRIKAERILRQWDRQSGGSSRSTAG